MKEKVLVVLSTCIITVSLLSFLLSNNFFIFDLFSHFQLQYALVIFILGCCSFFLKKQKLSFFLISYFLILIAFVLIPFSLFSQEKNTPDIFFMNIFFHNTNIEIIENYINSINPETVALVEANDVIKSRISETYGEPLIYHNEEAKSCAVFSKTSPVRAFVDASSTYPICIVEFNEYTLLVVHPYPPLSNDLYEKQKEHFEYVKILLKALSKESKDFVLVGDFNSSYYSALFRNNFKTYWKKNMYSWSNPGLLMIPIDHALSNRDLEVSLTERLSSDHRGLLINIK